MTIDASNAGPYLTAITFVMKFFVSMTFYAVYLQSVETYPTCLRQTGTSLGIVASNTFGMLGPYIVYLVRNLIELISSRFRHSTFHVHAPPPFVYV